MLTKPCRDTVVPPAMQARLATWKATADKREAQGPGQVHDPVYRDQDPKWECARCKRGAPNLTALGYHCVQQLGGEHSGETATNAYKDPPPTAPARGARSEKTLQSKTGP